MANEFRIKKGLIVNETDLYVSGSKLGIGTTTPSQTLTVAGNISGSGTLNIDGTATVDGTLTAAGGINGLTLTNGISGNNFNISGVNQVSISDPGEGIVFGGGASGNITLAIVDDASDNILRLSGTGAELQVGTNRVLTTADEGSGNGLDADTVDGLEASQFLRSDADDTTTGFIAAGNAGGTSGAKVLRQRYSGDDNIATLGTMYSSGNWLLAYGIDPKNGSSGYVSSFDNFSGKRSAIEIGNDNIEIHYATAQATAVGSDITGLTTPFIFDLTNTRMGIGTDTPSVVLEVADVSPQIQFTDTVNASAYSRILATDAGGVIIDADKGNAGTSSYISLRVDDSEKMRIDSSGNVGIGTTSPSGSLHIGDNDSTRRIILHGANSQTTSSEIIFGDAKGGAVPDVTYAGMGIRYDSQNNNLSVRRFWNGSSAVDESFVNFVRDTRLTSFTSNVEMSGDLTVGGIVTAQEFHTEFVSASIIYQSGSTKFGDTSDDVHEFSGSLRVTGSGNHYFSDGNVGIGTTSPGAKLTVAGSAISISNGWTGSHDILFVGGSPSSTGAANQTAARIRSTASAPGGAATGDLLFTVNSGDTFVNALYIEETGNVGIGTTSPTASLHVAGPAYFSGGTVSFNDTKTDVGIVINENDYIYTRDGDNLRQLIGKSSTDVIIVGQAGTSLIDEIRLLPGTDGPVTFYSGSSEYARFDAGRLGIGTNSPDAHLEISANAGADPSPITNPVTLRLTDSGNAATGAGDTTNPWAKIEFYSEDLSSGGPAIQAQIATIYDDVYSAGSHISFSNTSVPTNGLSEKMRITSTGNVGIGTTSPAAQLHISESNGREFKFLGGSQGHAFEYIERTGYTTGTANFYIQDADNDDTRATLRIKGNNGAVESLFVASSGKVGIGTTSPSSKLHVNGDTYVSGEFGQGVAITNKTLGYGAEFRSSGASIQIVFGRDTNSTGSGAIGADNNSIFSAWNVDSGASEKFRIGKDGQLYITQYIYHSGDEDTYLNFGTNSINLRAGGGTDNINITTSDVVINEGGNGYNFRVESDTVTHALFVTGSTGNVGIGTTSPSQKLTVAGTISGSSDLSIDGNSIFDGTVGYNTFNSGFGGNGWRIDSNANAEFENLTVRGTFSVYELLAQQIRATNGSLLVATSGKVDTSTGGTTGTLTFDTGNVYGHGFLVNDIILAQRLDTGGTSLKRTFLRVDSRVDSGSLTYTVLDGDNPEAGQEFVRIGNTTDTDRQGHIYLTADDNFAPYIGVRDGVNAYTDFTSGTGSVEKVRVGRLDGVTSANFGSLSGYGLWASGSVYLEGGINATSGKIADLNITSTKIYTGAGNFNNADTGFYVDNSSNFSLGSKFSWNGSALTIDGNITATAGNIGGFTISSDALSGTNFYLSGSATGNEFFISSSNFNVKANGDITASNASLIGGTIGDIEINGTAGSLTSGEAFIDTFSAAELDNNLWYNNSSNAGEQAVIVNGALRLENDNDSWDYGIVGKKSFSRNNSPVFVFHFKVLQAGGAVNEPRIMIGVTDDITADNYADNVHSIYFTLSNIIVYEGGNNRGTISSGNVATGDTFKVIMEPQTSGFDYTIYKNEDYTTPLVQGTIGSFTEATLYPSIQILPQSSTLEFYSIYAYDSSTPGGFDIKQGGSFGFVNNSGSEAIFSQGGFSLRSSNIDVTGNSLRLGDTLKFDGSNLVITGSINATSGNFTGTISAGDGDIGGWTIGASSLTAGDATLADTGNLTLGTSNDVVRLSANDGTYRLWTGHATAGSAPFRVTKAGALTATSATITGDITATNITATTAGNIAGWSIGSNTLSSGDVYLSNVTNEKGLYIGDGLGAPYRFQVGEFNTITPTSTTITQGSPSANDTGTKLFVSAFPKAFGFDTTGASADTGNIDIALNSSVATNDTVNLSQPVNFEYLYSDGSIASITSFATVELQIISASVVVASDSVTRSSVYPSSKTLAVQYYNSGSTLSSGALTARVTYSSQYNRTTDPGNLTEVRLGTLTATKDEALVSITNNQALFYQGPGRKFEWTPQGIVFEGGEVTIQNLTSEGIELTGSGSLNLDVGSIDIGLGNLTMGVSKLATSGKYIVADTNGNTDDFTLQISSATSQQILLNQYPVGSYNIGIDGSPGSPEFFIEKNETDEVFRIDTNKNIEVQGNFYANSGNITGSNFQVGEYISHIGDTNTFIRFQTDDISLTAAGNNLFRVDNTAPVREIVVNEAGAATNFRVESDTVTDALFVTASNGYVGIGTTSPEQTLDVDGTVRIQSTGAATLILDGDTNNSGDSGETDSIIDMRHDAGTYGMRLSARNFSGKSAFRIQENRNGSYSERFYIDEDGDVGIGTITPSSKLDVAGDITTSGNLIVASGQGIDFSATGDAGGMTSELLDDYEEGTWTPAYKGRSGSTIINPTAGSTSNTSATYTKIGNKVFFSCYMRSSGITFASTTYTLVVDNLPFVCGEYTSVGISYADQFAGDYPAGGYVESGQDYIVLTYRDASDGDLFGMQTGDLSNGTSVNDIMIAGFYTI